MQEPSALGRVVELVRDLRQRCPWDGAQTSETLRPYLIEEVFELDHAIGQNDVAAIQTELGDVLLHLAFQVVLAEEQGAFGAEDVTRTVEEKMWRRHPHLFPNHADPAPRQSGRGAEGQDEQSGETGEKGEENPQEMWERRKLAERSHDRPSVLDGLPPIMPALVMAYRIQERVAGVGFDWPDVIGPLAKVREETDEVARELIEEPNPDRLKSEMGDLLFAMVNLARKAGCDPRAALEGANRSFSKRFRGLEHLAAERGIEVGRADLDTLDGLWDEVKKLAEGQRGRGAD